MLTMLMAPVSYCEPGYTHLSAVSVLLVTIPKHTIQQSFKIINAILYRSCEIHEILTLVA